MSSPLDSPSPPPSQEFSVGARQDLPLGGIVDLIRTERLERTSFAKLDLPKIADRIKKFVQADLQDRTTDNELRKQRYAKMRGWQEGKTWPWDDASDSIVPDMMSNTLGTQDSLVNAVVSTRPAITSKAVAESNRQHEETVDQLIDFQVFVEQQGEKLVGEFAEDFCNDSRFLAMVSWVKEDRSATEIHLFDKRPENRIPIEWHQQLIDDQFPTKAMSRPISVAGNSPADGWDFEVIDRNGDMHRVAFYTDKARRRGRERVQTKMKVTHFVNVFDGPKVRAMHYHEVLFPIHADNMQPPGPSNPNGATHVVLIDHPTLDELQRDARSGFYNVVDISQINELKSYSPAQDADETGHEKMLDDMTGVAEARADHEPTHRKFTRYMCFDMFDLDGDGINEDVVWWSLKEKDLVLKAAPLGELFPSRKPRRPLAEAVFLPVHGRAIGISLLELSEGLHDLKKELFDLMIDSGTITTMPYGFYKPTSTLTPATIRPGPGDMIPTSDPQKDIFFPNLGNANQTFALNGISVLERWEQDLTLQGDLQRGRIPAGRSAALRTSGGISQVLSQGEARPERILRRFFAGLADVWSLIHEANRHFLQDGKRIRLTGRIPEGADPYAVIERADVLDFNVDFEFTASILSSSKVARQQSLGELLGVYVQPLMIQAGIIDPPGIRRLLVDWAEARAIDGEQYLVAVPPDMSLPRITWAEAVGAIVQTNRLPEAIPAEDPNEHLQALLAFIQHPYFQALTPLQVSLYQQWAQKVTEFLQRMGLAATASQPGLIGPGTGQQGGEPNIESGQGGVLQANQPSDGTLPLGTGTPQ